VAEAPTYDPKLATPDATFDTVQTSAGPVHFPQDMPAEERQKALTQLGVTTGTPTPNAPAYDPKLAMPDVPMMKEAAPGFVAGVAQAGLRGAQESITQQGLRELVTPKSGYGPIGTAVRETALAPLEALGTITAPAAAIGGMAGEAAKRGVQAITPESLSPENDPTGSQAALLQHIPGAVGALIDFGTNMLLPSSWATGGINRLLHGWSARKYANELGGPKSIIQQGSRELTGGVTGSPRTIEEAGQRLAAAQYEASQSARAAASKLRADAISSIPTNVTIPNSLSDAIRDALPETGSLSTSAQRKLDRVAAELESPTMARAASKLPLTWRTSNIAGADPDFTAKILRAMGTTTTAGGPKNVTFAGLVARREALSPLARNATNDADRRLYQFVISAVDKDIDRFGRKYPQAATMYREFQSKYAGEVAQYHASEAPLRNLVENTNPSEMIGKLQNLDKESIRNIKAGIVAGPKGMPAMEQIKSGVVQNLILGSTNQITGEFDIKHFVELFNKRDSAGVGVTDKLKEILGDKFQHLAEFRDALLQGGIEKYPKNSGIVKMMGVYQGVTAAEQSLRMAPTMWYHLLRLGSIVMMPKLFGKFLENGRGAKLLAAGILAKPGSPQAKSITGAMETMARGLGATPAPLIVAKITELEATIKADKSLRQLTKAERISIAGKETELKMLQASLQSQLTPRLARSVPAASSAIATELPNQPPAQP
jgi:hypothetical protein